ncbi:Co2+/Mg2+ efflux protein ApaG [Alkalimonas sp. MEB108]|uniref:Protein ApaG n=1 Tax=Alkalimonas cellulosilytica TaxID=3058395 RepID=A0ABU7JA87_9GAMM|nr:Co2+/Mg2+ efflux protein ApaG [Alkalimonas sp. MEB108]MEE2002750.1 Co2+/Mg2+ efflux protein ApaG [Alkalimonas sp. MEB108]
MNPADILVTAETFYIAAQSVPDEHKYVFAYSIQIENKSAETVQLLRRHWLISDANGKQVEVDGDGVVGEQPVLAPNEKYSYTSGAILETPVGTMQGHYIMLDQTQQEFQVEIPLFRLALPNILH